MNKHTRTPFWVWPLRIALVIAVAVPAVNYVIQQQQETADTLAWCDEIAHSDASCPRYNDPQMHAARDAWERALEQEEAALLNPTPDTSTSTPAAREAEAHARAESKRQWCDRKNHRNRSCPRHNDPDMVAAREAEAPARAERHRAWCDDINHSNVGCRYSGLGVVSAYGKWLP